jgi:hypothetical protein
MRALFENLVGPELAAPAMWIAAVLILAILLLLFWRLGRRFSSGTFVMGGRNRKTRLAVMDATAIDSHRRLVLVRRDDVEHLILIGGPTDVVVEQNIRIAERNWRTTPPVDLRTAAPEEPAPRPAPPAQTVRTEPPRPATPQPQRPLQSSAEAAGTPPASRQSRPVPPTTPLPRATEPAPARPLTSPPAPHPRVEPRLESPAPAAGKPPPAAADKALDAALLDEFETSFPPAAGQQDKPSPNDGERSLEDEMASLLNDLSRRR